MTSNKNSLKQKKESQSKKEVTKEIKQKKARQAKGFKIAPPTLHAKALIATASADSISATITIQFFLGKGQLTASLFRNGLTINSQAIGSDSTIFFSDTQSGDVISINGVATGVNPENGSDIPNAAIISINRPTSPSTPEQFRTGFIIENYIVL